MKGRFTMKTRGLDLQIQQVEQKIERLNLHLESLLKMKELKKKQSEENTN